MRAADQEARDRALDPRGSFIVQAPAGSGKTELLIQRFLALLSIVERPESVVAITFTRKAAGEMRRRVLAALDAAAGPAPDAAHERRTWELARAAREHDQERGWNITGNPHRLEIRTIDSLCAALVRRMPWSSRLGPPPAVVEDAREIYREAARATVAMVEDDDYREPVGRLLMHVDNDVAALEGLIASMLACRDQWLRITGSGISADRSLQREALERTLREVIVTTLQTVREAFPEELAAELPAFIRYAAGNLDEPSCLDLCALPEASLDALPQWFFLRQMICKEDGKRRATVTVKQGFPPGPVKLAFLELLATIGDELCSALNQIRTVPPASYDDQQWAIVDALLEVLPLAAAHLKMVFRRRGETDFNEIMLAALRALGDEMEPSALALALDARIEHLLVDEFQDTSYSQFELIEKLTAGWEPDDGRTLFLVGDPMQSIYRFREAEVGLFLKAASSGIGQRRLDPLHLTVNFRSDGGVVNWVNQVFPEAMPRFDDVATGAVRFAASIAFRPEEIPEPVRFYPVEPKDDAAESRQVVEILQAAWSTNPAAKAAILVRARTHLPSILRALREADVRYQAIDIDCLSELPVIQDLLALTRALLHPADRVAWLAVLRAPWCGLTLEDLYALAGDDMEASVWDLARDEARTGCMGEAAAGRLRRVLTVLESCFAATPASLRQLVEGAWIALGGPACAAASGDVENARAFFDLIEELDDGCDADLDSLNRQISGLFAGPDPEAGDSLQVMTIHKAKGLEFDIVIVPGLGRHQRNEGARLMLWSERPGCDGAGFLLAPLKPAAAERDTLYEFVKSFDKRKEEHENGRLLYVACTRARKQLHLFGWTGWIAKKQAWNRPPAGSLLAKLWHVVEGDFSTLPAPAQPEPAGEPSAPPPQVLRRLDANWNLPAPPEGVRWVPAEPPSEPASAQDTPSFRWVGDTLRHIGTVVHAILQEIARDGVAQWDQARVEAARPRIETALRGKGVAADELDGAVRKVQLAIERTLADEQGRWVLDDARHREASSELAFTGVLDGKLVSVRVDRTFVDVDGTRWIVDFKTSSHAGAGLEEFLANEAERYRGQMETYRRLLSLQRAGDVRAALYFPLLARLQVY